MISVRLVRKGSKKVLGPLVVADVLARLDFRAEVLKNIAAKKTPDGRAWPQAKALAPFAGASSQVHQVVTGNEIRVYITAPLTFHDRGTMKATGRKSFRVNTNEKTGIWKDPPRQMIPRKLPRAWAKLIRQAVRRARKGST